MPNSEKVSFTNDQGITLDARMELPDGEPKAYGLFAHCFTCSKDIAAASRICRALADIGMAVLRFDFTGLGNSDGDFANTNFSSNVQDLLSAANFLRENYQAPQLIIGHSLGGAAVLATAGDIPEVKAVVSIAAPSDPGHVSHLFDDDIEEIEREGEAKVNLAGREFTIQKHFLEDIAKQELKDKVAALHRALLVLHSPVDETVDIDHARRIYESAKHPKSYISLDKMDHLLTKPADSQYVAELIAAWASRYV